MATVSQPAHDSSSVVDPVKERPLFNRFYFEYFALFLTAGVLYLWTAPWLAVQCGADEGMEFSKMVLLLRHPDLTQQAWNDQPWFYSQIFSQVFKITGFDSGIPRLATFVITIAMLISFRRLMPLNARWPHLVCAWGFFFCWQGVIPLSMSAMLELPAFGLAIIACALSPRSHTEWWRWRFCCVGILLGLGVAIKLTAAIVFPALLLKLAILWSRDMRGSKPRNSSPLWFWSTHWMIAPLIGLIAFAVTLGLSVYSSPNWSWSLIWGNHQAAAATVEAAGFRFHPPSLLQSPGTCLGGLLGLIVIFKARRARELAFPTALLATVFLIHLNHYPWWSYYSIHFAVPLTIISGWGVGELLRISSTAPDDSVNPVPTFNKHTSIMVASLALALWAGFELPHGFQDALVVKERDRIATSEVINVLKPYRGQTKWAYTRLPEYSTQSGYVLPPELTVLPKKRFWTREATEETVFEAVKRYDCEVLILLPHVELTQGRWNHFLQENYVNIWSSETLSIFVTKRLNPVAAPRREDMLRQLGL